ncbi:MAG TPA: Stp1/IreP family PP2C-type Ser/Thr phosphatase [Niabella sp.]|nr:Stp1/IreP family PP2C-type Ser/Thr phosphatase [Niabella sp.]HOZ96643.1 Stp1/IreP family PP2C-type Ser/Thr phosphatase [Niabella sp.]HQX41511.1 Stp1/IreP family PP2C-type Ser/Thr phosphatase [Niabella sp.]HRC04331.1 Stp1/IreP family PP2C-type Ser/Thr phosphatase [Niabella sp.]HRC10037.1 Stp1/IreP family PP2C-type Ser/Thr phosphatase [Niabella sp.]
MGWFGKKKPLKLLHFRNRLKLGKLSTVIISDLGCVRKNNEDGALVCYADDETVFKKRGTLLILADGMGGHNSGEVASEIALTVFADSYYHSKGGIEDALKKAFLDSNNHIYETALGNDVYAGMGTTLTAIVNHKQNLYLAHIGDSRAYLFRNNGIEQLSKDHTVVQQLIDLGEISMEEAPHHPQRNMLLCALGTQPDIEPEVHKIKTALKEEDILLLCSDGLYDLVSEEDMIVILSSDNSLEQMANQLVNLAKQHGGHDNITVLLASENEQFSIPQLRSTSEFDIPIMNEN